MRLFVLIFLMSIHFQASAVFVFFNEVINEYKFDGVIEDSELKKIIQTVRNRELANEGATSDCHILLDIIRYNGILKDQEKPTYTFSLNDKDNLNLINQCGLKFLNTHFDFETQKETLKSQLEQIVAYPNQPITGYISGGYKVMALNLTTLPTDRRSHSTPRDSSWVQSNGYFSLDIQSAQAGDKISIWIDNEHGEHMADAVLDVGYWLPDSRPPVLNKNLFLLKRYADNTDYLTSFASSAIGEPNLQIRFYPNISNNPLSDLTPLVDFSLGDTGKMPVIMNNEQLTVDPQYLDRSQGIDYQIYAKEPSRNEWVYIGLIYGENLTKNEQGQFILAKDHFNETEPLNSGGPYNNQHVSYFKFDGPLFDTTTPDISDVTQGNISDCYFAGALRAVAHYYPDILQNDIIKLNTELSTPDKDIYTVRFFELDNSNNRKPTSIVKEYHVDAYLPASSSGLALYMRGTYKGPFAMELWGPLIEKAYVIHRSNLKKKDRFSYEYIGGPSQGQLIHFLLNSLIGGSAVSDSPYHYYKTTTAFAESIEKHYDFQNSKFKGPVLIETIQAIYDPLASYRYKTEENIVGNHQYVILDYDKANQKVLITNPWNQFEPIQDGLDDGQFWVPVEFVYRNFHWVYFYNLNE